MKRIKVVAVGDATVGKTSLSIPDDLPSIYVPTVSMLVMSLWCLLKTSSRCLKTV